MLKIEEIQQRHWDYLVVGTGVGGATLGAALAKAGRAALFPKRGAPLSFIRMRCAEHTLSSIFLAWRPHRRATLPSWLGRDVVTTRSATGSAVSFPSSDVAGRFECPLRHGDGALLSRRFRAATVFPDVDASSVPEAWPSATTISRPFTNRRKHCIESAAARMTCVPTARHSYPRPR